jgi:ankyrin repeat protein
MINPRSPLAVLFASLIVAASGEALTVERSSLHRLSVVRLKLGPEERKAWVRAIGNDEIARIKLMIAQHDPVQLLALTASNGKTALMVASKLGDLPLAKVLAGAGARINAVTETNGTALMFAVLGNQKPVAEWLFTQGADIDVVGSNGWTALTIAAAKGYDQLLTWLIDRGANTQVRDVYRYTPLLRAVENNHETSAELLLSLPDTDVNIQNEFGNTALHHAVSTGNVSMVTLLLESGADPSVLNREGVSARMLAKDRPLMEALLK